MYYILCVHLHVCYLPVCGICNSVSLCTSIHARMCINVWRLCVSAYLGLGARVCVCVCVRASVH